ncbi:CopD family protein [Marinimicrobium sp. ABcell2]|uniref:CopD family protein n=1 Tax=Marinimicrobium sp. ABcell2 TaxID=3069751 RepID=UPI0027B06362|nr:CopD family protein [Marinimicrobium sp. ABcell2]MDQ2076845.1 CopD family protein [Marinimicrobium sp. ABcell2]
MLWFLVLHISALLFWCAALLYLPALIVGAANEQIEITETPYRQDSVARFVFTHIATPAALLAIIFGTLVFVVEPILDPWLIVKLTLVAGLVVAHASSGLLVLRLERQPDESQRLWCWVLGVVLCVLMLLIVWIVLAKPPAESFPWLTGAFV